MLIIIKQLFKLLDKHFMISNLSVNYLQMFNYQMNLRIKKFMLLLKIIITEYLLMHNKLNNNFLN